MTGEELRPLTDEDPHDGTIPSIIEELTGICEAYAKALFDTDEYFTQITKWKDGDFRILVWHGKGHYDDPYRVRAEKITYRHHDGAIIYADVTRRIDHHTNEYHESIELERR